MKFHEWNERSVSSELSAATKSLASLFSWWKREVRPYYKSWPAITGALSTFRLDIPIASIKSDRVFLIRFPEENEPEFELKRSGVTLDPRISAKITTVLTGCVVDGPHNRCGMMFAFQRIFDGELYTVGATGFASDGENETVEEWLDGGRTKQIKESGLEDGLAKDFVWGLLRIACRIAVACHLLADDPSIITPDVLSKDRDRYDRETDEAWKERAVERARRRGVVGWNIGADYEVCPHYRRPHFGIRYTGKGGTVPRIVPIKGAVVHRSKLTEVPTGYILPDGREVEP